MKLRQPARQSSIEDRPRRSQIILQWYKKGQILTIIFANSLQIVFNSVSS